MSLQKISVIHKNCQRFYDGEWICTVIFVTIIPERWSKSRATTR